MKILIRNATIVDGTGCEPFRGNIMLENDTIQNVSHLADIKIDNMPEEIIQIDATNLYVTPGFIDMHTHSDLANFMPNLLQHKIMQGITTEVIGQCGFSVAPMPKAKQRAFKSQLIIGDPLPTWHWESMAEYLQALSIIGVESNAVPFVGHGTLRFAVAENAARLLTHTERYDLTNMIEASFAVGVFGLSLGLIYVPAIFANTQELKIIANAVGKINGLISVHLRSESDELIESLNEMINLAAATNCRLHISHLKTIGKKNWHKLTEALHIIETNNLTFDHYPYTAGSTTLLSLLPPFLLKEIKNLQELTNPIHRKTLRNIFSGAQQPPAGEPWDNLPNLLGWENIVIVAVNSTANQKYVGLNLLEVANITNKKPTDALIDLLVADNGLTKMIDYHSDELSITTKLLHQSGVIGTDTLFGGKLHPRVTGTFPKLFQEYVFDKKIISIEKLVKQMTTKPAAILGLQNRGAILAGYKADLVLFDKNFAARSTFDNPELSPVGLHHVIINGKFKVKNGIYQSEVRSGAILNHANSSHKNISPHQKLS